MEAVGLLVALAAVTLLGASALRFGYDSRDRIDAPRQVDLGSFSDGGERTAANWPRCRVPGRADLDHREERAAGETGGGSRDARPAPLVVA